MNNLDSRLRAWNPVRVEDVADTADSASAATLLQRVLDQPVTGHAPRPSTRRRRRALAGVTAVAAAAALVAVVLQGPSATRAAATHHPALDMHLVSFTVRHGDIVARITDPDAAASQLTAVFRAHGLNITVKAIPVSPSLVGTITFSQVSTIRTLWRPACSLSPPGCPVGLVIPANFTGIGSIVVGRAAKPGEKYGSMSDSFAPGEALHCSGLVGQPASAALPVLRKLGLRPIWWELAGNGHSERTPAGYIVAGTPISATQVSLDIQPTPPHGSQFRTEVAQEDRDCR